MGPAHYDSSLSRPLTIFWGVAHGEAVGVSLNPCLKWNAEAIEGKLPDLWSAMGVKGLEEGCIRIDRLMANCGLRRKLRPMGASSGDMDRIMECVPWERLASIPRAMERSEARTLMGSLL